MRRHHLLGQDMASRHMMGDAPPYTHGVPLDRIHPSLENCNEDGSFRPRHCNYDTADCWCVNDHGVPVPGTFGALDCGESNCDVLTYM